MTRQSYGLFEHRAAWGKEDSSEKIVRESSNFDPKKIVGSSFFSRLGSWKKKKILLQVLFCHERLEPDGDTTLARIASFF